MQSSVSEYLYKNRLDGGDLSFSLPVFNIIAIFQIIHPISVKYTFSRVVDKVTRVIDSCNTNLCISVSI